MTDPEDKPAVPDEQESSDAESVKSAPNADDVPQLDSHEAHDDAVPVELQDASARQRQRRDALDEGSEMGSIDAGSVDTLPRRADSPIDSMLSGPDDTPSVQVCQAVTVLHERGGR